MGKNFVDLLPSLPMKHREHLLDSMSMMGEIGTGGNVACLVSGGSQLQVSPGEAVPFLNKFARATAAQVQKIHKVEARVVGGRWQEVSLTKKQRMRITSTRFTQLSACKMISVKKSQASSNIGKARRTVPPRFVFTGIVD